MASFISSDGARSLGKLIESLAREWIADTTECNDVNSVFSNLRGIMDRALARVARDWNSGHDVSRAVPTELMEACFFRLPADDKAQLALVCSHWRTNVVTLQDIWTRLDLYHWKPSLEVALARSGALPLHLTVHAGADPILWDGTLRAHAGRIKALKLSVTALESGTLPALHYAFPILEELSLSTSRLRNAEYTVSHLFLDQHAHRLRRLHLTDMAIPKACLAFAQVTRLTIDGGRDTLEHLFDVMPLLEQLVLNTFDNSPGLPPLPIHCRLQMVSLTDIPALSVGQLVHLGYTGLPALTLSGEDDVRHLIDAAAQFPDSQSALCVSTDCCDITLELGCSLRFTVQLQRNSVLQQLLCSHGSAFYGVQTLTLPASLSRVGFLVYPTVLLQPDAIAQLPALETLVLECAGQRHPEDTVPFSEFLAGTFYVPGLARVRIVAAPEARDYCVIERVEVHHLASFIENTLVCNSLDIFVDSSNGVALDGDLEELRGCVANVII